MAPAAWAFLPMLALIMAVIALVVGVIGYVRASNPTPTPSVSPSPTGFGNNAFGSVRIDTLLPIPGDPGELVVALDTLDQVGGWTLNGDGAMVVPQSGRYEVSYAVAINKEPTFGGGVTSIVKASGTALTNAIIFQQFQSTITDTWAINQLTFIHDFTAGDALSLAVTADVDSIASVGSPQTSRFGTTSQTATLSVTRIG